MKKKIGFLFILAWFCFTVLPVYAQQSNLYLPLNIQKAFQSGTRSADGNPGPKYWQNRSDYKIDVELIPAESLLKGVEEITYFNNSPDTLNTLVFRLYQDIFKEGNARQSPVAVSDLTKGVKIRVLTIDGDSIRIMGGRGMFTAAMAQRMRQRGNQRRRGERPRRRRGGFSGMKGRARRTATNLIVTLNTPIPPGKSAHVHTAWEFTISKTTHLRMGQYSDTEFFIGYFYPQIAVYDDIDGWDRIEYGGNVEFYNDFNKYDLSVSVPGDYVVWATGVLQNPDQVLQKNIVDRYKKAQSSDEVIQIIKPEDYKKKAVTQNNDKNRWQFKAQQVTDISFAVSNRYRWDGVSVVVDDANKRRVFTDAAYPDSTVHYEEAAQIARTTVEYLSKELPGVPYPYPKVTTFCNGGRGGGMEWPMMTNDGAPSARASSIGLIFHEIAHTYFPFYMGTNERKYAWMDEGWATFFPREVVERLEPKYDYQRRSVISAYERFAGKEAEMPMIIPTYLLSGRSSMGVAAYSRPATAYSILMDILGRDLFRSSLQEYIKRWHGRHPIPVDFFNSINDACGENLNWFWRPWFYNFGYPDLTIHSVTENKDNVDVTVKKIGRFPVPVKLTFVYSDSTKEEEYRSAKVWQNGDEKIQIMHKTGKKLAKIILGGPHIPDMNKENNRYNF